MNEWPVQGRDAARPNLATGTKGKITIFTKQILNDYGKENDIRAIC